MKTIVLASLGLLLTLQVYAQRNVVKSESLSGQDEVHVNFKFADDIRIVHWNDNQIKVEASVDIDNGEGNDSFSIKTEQFGDVLRMYSDFDNYWDKRWKNRKGNSDCCNSTTNIFYTVYIPKNKKLKVKSISGDLIIDTYTGDLTTDLVSGDVTIKSYNGDLKLKTVSGDLDVTMDKAEVNARTVTGTIYSDLDIDQGARKSKNYGSTRVKGSINGGDQLIVLETVSGNIYMRKG